MFFLTLSHNESWQLHRFIPFSFFRRKNQHRFSYIRLHRCISIFSQGFLFLIYTEYPINRRFRWPGRQQKRYKSKIPMKCGLIWINSLLFYYDTNRKNSCSCHQKPPEPFRTQKKDEKHHPKWSPKTAQSHQGHKNRRPPQNGPLNPRGAIRDTINWK